MGYSARKVYEFGWGGDSPTRGDGAGAPVSLAGLFQFAANGFIVGARYYRDLADDFNHIAYVLDPASGDVLSTLHFPRKPNTGSGPDGWQHAYFRKRIPVSEFDIRSMVVWFGGGYFYVDDGDLVDHGYVSGNVETLQTGLPYDNMQYTYNHDPVGFSTFNGARYGVDVIFWAHG